MPRSATRGRTLGHPLLRLFCAVLVAISVGVLAAGAPVAAALFHDTDLEDDLFQLMNQERVARGLDSFEWHPVLQEAARQRSWDMASRGYFSHYSPEGETVFDLLLALGYTRRTVGENIGYTYLDGRPSAIGAHRMFMQSAPHAAQILSPRYNRVGVGEVSTDGGVRYYTVVFSE